jgi:hypothetical protein
MASEEFGFGLHDHLRMIIQAAPWWLYSALVHVGLILVLVLMPFTTIAPPQKKIVIETPMEQIEERVDPPVQKEVITEETREQSASLVAGPPIQMQVAAVIAETQVNAPVIAIEAPTSTDLAKMVDRGGSGIFPTFGTGGSAGAGLFTTRVGASRPYDYESVMDKMAEDIVRDIQRSDLLVVLLFDESKSLLEDRKIITQKISRVVADLRKEMKPREAARLKWAVVSYSAKPTLWLQPTDKIEDLMESAKKIKIDDSGVENICAAIVFAVKTLGPLGKKMYLVNISDEEGNDTRNEKAYAEAVTAMQGAKIRFFTFGREAQFQQGNAFEWLRDSKGERVGPWFWAQRGIESCQYEFFPTDWRFNPHRGPGQMGSGFGCYTLATLSDLTKGTFFILSEVPSAYDEEKMDKFKPEWVPPAEYRDRNGKSKVRTTIRKIIDEWGKVAPPSSLWQLDRLRDELKEAIAKGEKAMKWIEGAVDEMEVLRARKGGEKFAKKRWEANFDLILAQMYRLRFTIRDYLACVREVQRKGFPKPKPNQKFNYYAIGFDASITEPHTGQRGIKEMEQAKKALEQIQNDYFGTPWGDAGKMLKNLAPARVYPAFDIAVTRVKG